MWEDAIYKTEKGKELTCENSTSYNEANVPWDHPREVPVTGQNGKAGAGQPTTSLSPSARVMTRLTRRARQSIDVD